MWPLSAMAAAQSTGTGAPLELAESAGTWSRVAMAAPALSGLITLPRNKRILGILWGGKTVELLTKRVFPWGTLVNKSQKTSRSNLRIKMPLSFSTSDVPVLLILLLSLETKERCDFNI